MINEKNAMEFSKSSQSTVFSGIHFLKRRISSMEFSKKQINKRQLEKALNINKVPQLPRKRQKSLIQI